MSCLPAPILRRHHEQTCRRGAAIRLSHAPPLARAATAFAGEIQRVQVATKGQHEKERPELCPGLWRPPIRLAVFRRRPGRNDPRIGVSGGYASPAFLVVKTLCDNDAHICEPCRRSKRGYVADGGYATAENGSGYRTAGMTHGPVSIADFGENELHGVRTASIWSDGHGVLLGAAMRALRVQTTCQLATAPNTRSLTCACALQSPNTSARTIRRVRERSPAIVLPRSYVEWCAGPDSNRQATYAAAGFKPAAVTDFATGARVDLARADPGIWAGKPRCHAPSPAKEESPRAGSVSSVGAFRHARPAR